MQPLHRAAREYAKAGIPVFPCEENGKRPACANGFKDATTDLAQIDAWWGENSCLNIGMCPHDAGWCVVDLDPPVGLQNWDAKIADNETPETYVVETPRGGQHWYFTGDLPPTASKIAPKVDTRGLNSYVLVPPSIINGKPYAVIHDRDIAPVPLWVSDAVKVKLVEAKAAVHERDLASAVSRARHLLVEYVRRGDVAREGSGGNHRTYQLSCELLNLGLSADCARELLTEIWNDHCVPPWSDDELRVIMGNAENYAQNEAGAWGVAPAAEVFGAALDRLPKAQTQERRSRFHLEDEDEQDNTPEPTWLVKDLLQAGTTALLVGTSGSYKSFLALDIALALASGTSTFGTEGPVGPTVYAALEGKRAIKKARRSAWRMARNITGPIKDFYVMTAPMIAIDGEMQEFGDEIAKRCGDRNPVLIILDTAAKCMAGLNENDAMDVGKLIRFCDSLTEAFGCVVLVIHHKSDKANASDLRGSSAFRAGFNTTLEVTATRATKAVEVRVKQHKDADEVETPWTFQGRVVGPSLVFFPTSTEEHKALAASEDDLDPRKVGEALQHLNAYGLEHGVSTNVLASSLLPQLEGESTEHRATSLGAFSKRLGAMSRGKLKAYNIVRGAGIVWCLPERSVN